MTRQLANHSMAAVLLAGFVAASFSPTHAQYAEFRLGGSLESMRPGSVVKASVAVDNSGAIAILASAKEGREAYLIVWKLRPDGSREWSRAWSLADVSPTLDLEFTPDGSLVIAGAFYATLDLGSGPLVSVGGTDILLAKLDPNGNHVWSRSFGSGGNDLGYQILIALDGGITLVGKHTGVDFGGGRLDAPVDATSFFRATFGPDGSYVSSASFGSSAGTAGINDMAISAAGDVYAMGGFHTRLTFGATILQSAGSADVVMVGFDPLGNVRTAQRFGDEYFDTGYGVVLTPEGDLVTTGIISHDVSVGGPVLDTCASVGAVFVARYTADGVHRWSRTNETCAYGASECTAIALHPSGGIAVTGMFKGEMQFDHASLSADDESMLALRFDADGNFLWMGEGAVGAKGLAVVAKPDGNVVVAGSNSSDLEFCSGRITRTALARGFVAEFSDVAIVDTQAPAVPANPTYDGTTLRWDPSTDPEGASVRYKIEEKPYYSNFADRRTFVSGTSLALDAVGNVSDFIYITAIDCFDHASQPSIRLEIHPTETAPLTPGDVHFEGGSLVWTMPTDADVVGVAVDALNRWTATDTVRLGLTMAPTLNVENLSYEIYFIAAVDASGNWSPRAIRMDGAPPPAPTALTYTIPILTWDASQDIGFGAFEVYASRFSDFAKERRLIERTRQNTFDVPIDQRDSYYHVIQVDRTGNRSAPASVAGPGGARPGRPRSLAYKNGRLTWEATDDDIDRYEISASRSESSEGLPRFPLGNTDALEFEVSGADHRWYFVEAIDEVGQVSATAVVSAITGLAPSFTLALGVLSNPFRGSTTLQYSLPAEGDVKVSLFDVRGALVATLVNGRKAGGTHYVDWGGVSENSGEAPAGVYFARLQFEQQERSTKLVLLR